ncbi:hypothetical protein Q7C_794 [Methylophaga frappieri]|uniref:Uncharacterized protein n=1 Tax=Methylophaga frappieri (strain ATCC BAA-2434 / DSM 25690 / JAM7) TaxID=754477 RepID=I1YGC0_METFJ|nr:hypothetical protein [Methylophaga frappieri]AFJ01963.1 hypothetical protein Q7C_794 [Methylophaga frappieri]
MPKSKNNKNKLLKIKQLTEKNGHFNSNMRVLFKKISLKVKNNRDFWLFFGRTMRMARIYESKKSA